MKSNVSFIKVVVDVSREIIAVGAELHFDEEQALLDDGSNQRDLWGANLYPLKKEIEFSSLINIRPLDRNYTQEIEDRDIKDRVRDIVFRYLIV